MYHTHTGVLTVVQNKEYQANRVVARNPIGAHCITGAQVDMTSTGCSTGIKTKDEIKKLIYSGNF